MNNCAYCLAPTSNPKFCSRSCSAIFQNKEKPRRKRIPRYCRNCQIILAHEERSTFCIDCRFSRANANKTIGELIGKRRYQKHSQIRNMAREFFMRVTENLSCAVCGYDKHIEVCHIRPMYSFSEDSLVSEVNHIDNLLGLCPNHHWEFDKGFLDHALVSQLSSKQSSNE